MKAVAAFVASIGCACTPMATRDDSSNDREVAFSCANGESLSVRFLPAQSVAVLVRNGKTIELQQQPSGSGFIYSNGPNTIRGKGNDLTVEIGAWFPFNAMPAEQA